MSASVGCVFRWGFECLNGYIQSVSKLYSHVVVKAKSGNNCGLASECAIRHDTGPIGGQAHNVLTSPISACGNTINDKFATFCQVDEKGSVGTFYGQNSILLKNQNAEIGRNFATDSQSLSSVGPQAPAHTADEKGRSAEECADRPTEQGGGDD